MGLFAAAVEVLPAVFFYCESSASDASLLIRVCYQEFLSAIIMYLCFFYVFERKQTSKKKLKCVVYAIEICGVGSMKDRRH